MPDLSGIDLARLRAPSACVSLAGAAVFDSLEQVADAWRLSKGDTAGSSQPELVTEYGQLACLLHCQVSPEGTFRGDEPRAFTDNLFRASRRIHENAEVMDKLGQRWPEHRNLYHDRGAGAGGYSAGARLRPQPIALRRSLTCD